MREISNVSNGDPIIIAVGNKSDLSEDRQVTQDDINDFKQRTGFDVIEVSAKTSYNIKELMGIIKRMLISKKCTLSPEKETKFSSVRYKQKKKLCGFDLNEKQAHGCCK
jgi:50S ribosomal subunit-associated GTPase HflX